MSKKSTADAMRRRAATGLTTSLCLSLFAPALPAKEGSARPNAAAQEPNPLELAQVGAHSLRVLSPTVLELHLVTTKEPEKPVTAWNFVSETGQPQLPPAAEFEVLINGKRSEVAAVGFKRRPLYAPLAKRDLRIGNWLYLQLAAPIAEKASVSVRSAKWSDGRQFTAANDAVRLSPAIHVNQVGYEPEQTKRAMVGFYLGSLGEMEPPATTFALLDEAGKRVYSGKLTPRKDEGYTYAVKPYQKVFEADFSAWKTPGLYRLQVAGLGASFPFRIGAGAAALFARTYALGLYQQRCGCENALPFTRFTHGPCHVAPASVPTGDKPEFAKTQAKLASLTGDFQKNPRHTAPQLKNSDASLYPFVHQGSVNVTGGHHDAGDYSKYTINSSQLVHHLVFAADAFPGVATLDNLGIPESGDGKGDVIQIAKWEADFLTRMQDADGGFYFLVYPRERAYEGDVLPDRGDPQVVFPKTTAVTAAATAALAQAASSPTLKKQFPEAASLYLEAARKGWAFLQNALAKNGRDGAYQKITHYGANFMHDDELAWAATEIFLATGDAGAHEQMLKAFDPASRDTIHWGWERVYESYGCAIRSYAFASKTGRVAREKLDSTHLAKCEEQIQLAGRDEVKYARANAYGTCFPIEAKRFRSAGWYFSIPAAFDIAAALQIGGEPDWMDDILSSINYEAGTNPNNMPFLTGLGWRRQREIVHQYAQNDRRVLPPSGIPLGAVQGGFPYLDKYKRELGQLTFPSDGDKENPFPFYDRWADTFNTSTEFVVVNQVRGLATLAWLMAASPQAAQPWRAAAAKITGIAEQVKPGSQLRARFEVEGAEGLHPAEAQIVWETGDAEPRFGGDFTFTAVGEGPHWVEAEALWPDGRRAFAVFEFSVKN